jgi:MFS transporter, PAT family, beta-lactamase induction signal transducer AmpG
MTAEKRASFFKLWASHKMRCLLVLGFSSGLPLALCSSTLQAWLSSTNGISLQTIADISLVSLPYLWKFLWAPVLDRLAFPFLDKRRSWIVIMQLALSLVLVMMAQTDPAAHLTRLCSLAFLLAFLSATQDIAINAYQTEILSPLERGPGIALYTAGYRIAMVISGGLALILADRFGWAITYECMALLMLIGVAFTIFADSLIQLRTVITWRAAVMEPFKAFFQQSQALRWLLFIVLFKIGDAAVLTLSTPFLLKALHFTLTQVGILNKGVAIVGVLLGVVLGGFLLPRLKLYRALFLFGAFQAASNLAFALLAFLPPNFYLAGAMIFIEELAAGMATSVILALVMTLCRKPYTATQFALLTALAAMGRVFIGPVMGAGLGYFSWGMCFIIAFMISLPALFVLRYLKSSARLLEGV